jgi:hypothetical protein
MLTDLSVHPMFHSSFKIVMLTLLVFTLFKIWQKIPPIARVYDLKRWSLAFLWMFYAACVCLMFLLYCYLRRGENILAILLKRIFPKFIPIIGQVMLVTDFVKCVTTTPEH